MSFALFMILLMSCTSLLGVISALHQLSNAVILCVLFRNLPKLEGMIRRNEPNNRHSLSFCSAISNAVLIEYKYSISGSTLFSNRVRFSQLSNRLCS